MHRPLFRRLALTLALCLVSPAALAAKDTRDARATKGESFLSAFHSGHRQLIVINDPIPPAERALASTVLKPLSDRLKAGEVKGLSKLESTLKGWVEDRSTIPDELAVGLTDQGVAFLGRCLAVSALIEGMKTEHHSNPPEASGVTARVAALAEEIQGMSFEGITLFARMRTQDDAKAILAALAAQFTLFLPKGDGLALRAEEDQLVVTARLNTLIGASRRAKMLKDTLIADDEAHQKTLMGATSKTELTLSVRREGRALVVELGPSTRRKRPLRRKKLGGTFRQETQDLGWARWTGAPVAAAAERLLKTVSRFGAPVAIERALRRLPGYIGAFAKRSGDFRLSHAERGTRVVYNVTLGKAIQPIQKTYLPNLIPEVARGVWLSTAPNSASSGLSRALINLHGGLRSWLQPGEPVDFSAAALTTALHETIDKEVKPILSNGFGTILGWGGDVQRLTMTRQPEQGPSTEQGVSQLPNYGVGWLFPLLPGEDGLDGARTLMAAVVKASCGGEAPAVSAIKHAKLGLGSPTLAVDWGWLKTCSKDRRALQIDGDFTLHAFQLEDVLIISTSRALSAHIAATASGVKTPKRLSLSKYQTRSGTVSGRLIGLYVDMAQRWLPALVTNERAAAANKQLNDWLLWSQLGYDFFSDIKWEETGRRRRYEGRFELTWR